VSYDDVLTDLLFAIVDYLFLVRGPAGLWEGGRAEEGPCLTLRGPGEVECKGAWDGRTRPLLADHAAVVYSSGSLRIQ
jgi:hypothetical protein